MVARVNASRSLRNALHYNENKVRQSTAVLIHSRNFAKDTQQLGITDKLGTLQNLAARNERTKVNSVHISLNFDPSEKLDDVTFQRIADSYLQKIGFGDQPYLVYKHEDASHPHIHIVTTNIKRNGKRIALHNIGKNQSEKARKQIEKDFNLVRADSKQRQQAYEVKPVNAEKLLYGKNAASGTKRAIANVLDTVLPKYKYTSLPELNAVLRQYNIVADQGSKESRIYKSGGLVYRVLDANGQKVGVPIPASHIYNKPTLKNLEKNFLKNQVQRRPHMQRVRNAVDYIIATKGRITLTELQNYLQKERISLVVRQNADGIVYGLTYVDHKTQSVFNGSDLGKPYSSNQMQQRIRQIPVMRPETPLIKQHTSNSQKNEQTQAGAVKGAVESVFDIEKESSPQAEFDERKKKKRKRLFH
ncbi:relaxase/mobilization nuclease domain-containing protein [Chitinophaga sp. sic0106]|uniref:relaxase/mobilization nuclease domain-containing protein n=1 Tax=Chitinophaga sp. sic0106 TaxID=2854785 RepID=UPI001C46560A|nr:relaxase/mobilization nuclease domain-containing protein [Chitinophaga sp. sic0106]MBV7530441.1 relaxase/mobilization nuclease domain-containing protein [Chitinophaga sp. sic0106]